jgi:hypothetical protein
MEGTPELMWGCPKDVGMSRGRGDIPGMLGRPRYKD